MQWSDIQFNPSEKTLRQFAGLCLVIFGALAIIDVQFRNRPTAALVEGALAVGLGPLGLIAPRALKPVWIVWMVVAFPLGWLVSTVFLGVLFYGVFAPIGLAFRFAGRDALALKRADPNRQSYWTSRTEPRDARQYFRQS
jgi:RsiW-degrading membrane proteinase PrsW (M82 family)